MPRAAYLHVPFCRHRCGYCNFTLIAGREELVPRYLAALALELQQLNKPHEVDTLFFGGGTPTQLSADYLQQLFGLARQWFPLAAGGEFSVEANPLDLADPRKIEVLAAAGVTRISLGVQSFSDRKLQLLERDHRQHDVEQAFAAARGIAQSVSVDLIFGTPGETLAEWQTDINAALALHPDHLSTYGLTFERGTQFWNRLQREELARVEEDLERQFYEAVCDQLPAAGFEHYEVSNFAQAQQHCRHNEVYWLGGEYFAAGPGAARYLNGVREMNHRSTTTWMQRLFAGQSPVAEREELPAEDVARERLVFALRRLEGIVLAEFAATTGYEVATLIGPVLPRYLDLGLLELRGERLKLTRAGLLVSDAIWPAFLRG